MVGEVVMEHVCTHCAMNGHENAHTLRACTHKRKQGTTGSFHKGGSDEKKMDYKSSKHQSGSRHETERKHKKIAVSPDERARDSRHESAIPGECESTDICTRQSHTEKMDYCDQLDCVEIDFIEQLAPNVMESQANPDQRKSFDFEWLEPKSKAIRLALAQ